MTATEQTPPAFPADPQSPRPAAARPVTGADVARAIDDILAGEPAGPADDLPPGWVLLPAGPTRRLLVNRDFREYGEGPPFRVEADGEPESHAKEVRPRGEVRLMSAVDGADEPGCSRGRAWVETDGPVLILPHRPAA